MIIKLGVIGYPLGHTLSPVFQQAALDHLKINGQFKAIPITPEELPKFIRTMDKNNIKAVCVTIPHKESVLDLIDEIDPEALKIGAVNWIVNNEGNLKGFNTDYKGFLKSLEFETGFSPYKKTVSPRDNIFFILFAIFFNSWIDEIFIFCQFSIYKYLAYKVPLVLH